MLVLDVLECVHARQVVQMPNAGAQLLVQSGLLLFAALKFPLDAAHAGDDVVEIPEDVIWAGATLEGGVGCVF